jgi:hypothetical protein
MDADEATRQLEKYVVRLRALDEEAGAPLEAALKTILGALNELDASAAQALWLAAQIIQGAAALMGVGSTLPGLAILRYLDRTGDNVHTIVVPREEKDRRGEGH